MTRMDAITTEFVTQVEPKSSAISVMPFVSSSAKAAPRNRKFQFSSFPSPVGRAPQRISSAATTNVSSSTAP